jgi:hypothetical protein
MPGINDVYNMLVNVQNNTKKIHKDLQTVTQELLYSNFQLKSTIDILNAGFLNLSKGIKGMVEMQNHNNSQNDTIICILEKISENTCQLVNEAHKQSGLQTVIADKTTDLFGIYESAHANEAIEYIKLKEIRKDLLECCPQRPSEPPCHHSPCEIPWPAPEINIEVFRPINPKPDDPIVK